MRAFRRFRTEQGGATAVIFSLAFLPLMGAVGGALDYSRAANEQSKLQRAVDAAVLTLVREPRTATKKQLEDKAAAVFTSVYRPGEGVAPEPPSVDRVGDTIVLSRKARMPNAFMKVVGMPDTPVGATATAAWSSDRIEVALVLDNTGSMNDLIGGKRKIDVLIDATKGLLADFRGLADRSDAIKVSVVPFDTEVRLDPNVNRYKDWYRPMDPKMKPSDWTGYVIDRFGTFATSDAPLDGSENSRYPALRETGYKVDPDLLREIAKPIDLPAARPLVSFGNEADYNDTVRMVERMKPRGYTNIGIGVTWGLATLSKSEPFSEGADAADKSVKRYMIVLTDGDNTAYYKDGVLRNAEWERRRGNSREAVKIEAEMNATTASACANAKANVEVFTVRLLAGNETLLGNCASPPNAKTAQHYFNVQSPPQLSAAFRDILEGIRATRLTH